METLSFGPICARCVMDRSDPDIRFDQDGVCNHCHDTSRALEALRVPDDVLDARRNRVLDQIRTHGKNREYDCLIGVSGGVDSSYVAYLAKLHELRPLVVHFDNGWNSELAVQNIQSIMDHLGFELDTYVINWEEFKDLQRAFFRASVIDIELLTDHAITATMFHLARTRDIPYVLSGQNLATENGMPRSWIWFKQDARNIRAIHKAYGSRPIRSFPLFSTWQWLWNLATRRFKTVNLLDLVRYRKNDAIQVLTTELGWRYYGGKHYESVFTKYYQAHILPTKFGIDKRRCHFSSLIRNQEMTRDEALEALSAPLYDPIELRQDQDYILKKLEFTAEEFESIMRTPPRKHEDYPSDKRLLDLLRGVRSIWQNLARPRPGER